jgi:hypothetical protein
MNSTTNETQQRTLTTADLAASASRPERSTEGDMAADQRDEELEPLFADRAAADFRDRWSIVQQGFVDDPQKAVRQGDELVAQVIKSLAETFAKQRAALEGKQGSTEDLRLALRRYRSFFERLLSI